MSDMEEKTRPAASPLEESLLVGGGSGVKAAAAEEEEEARKRWEGFGEEERRLSWIALPMVVVTLSQYMVQVISVMMVGHLGELSLSSTAISMSLSGVTGFSVMQSATITKPVGSLQPTAGTVMIPLKVEATHAHNVVFHQAVPAIASPSVMEKWMIGSS